MVFSADQAEKLQEFLSDGVSVDLEGGAAYTILAHAVRIARRPAPNSVTVRSVKRLPKPADGYSCPGALAI